MNLTPTLARLTQSKPRALMPWVVACAVFSVALAIPVTASATWTAVEAGYSSYAIRDDGALYAWGSNTDGRLGDGSGKQQNKPVRVGSATWNTVRAGTGHALGVQKNGTLWSWGTNSWGQLGRVTASGAKAASSAKPVQVGTATWKAVDGAIHSLGIRSDGSLWGWGYNESGQVGNGQKGTGKHVLSPTRIGSDSDWRVVSAGGQRSYGIQTDGSLWAWGDNRNSRLGTGGYNDAVVPLPIGATSGWVDVSAGAEHALALRSDGSLWSWGLNTRGALGDGTTKNQGVPIRVGTGNDWVAISAGNSHSMAIARDGSLYVWGYNAQGHLGDGTKVNSLTPKKIGGAWGAVSAGSEHSLGIKTNRSVWGWGRGDSGQLGDGSAKQRLSPVQALAAVLPKVALGKPVLSVKSPKAKKTFTVSSTLKPTAAQGSKPVTMRFYKGGKLVKSVKATVSGTKVSTKTSLSAKGTYYVVAVFSATSTHATTTSAKLTFTVK